MKRGVARVLAVAAGLVVGVLPTTAPASADPRIPLSADPVPLPAGTYCDFEAVITFQDFNQYIIHQTVTPTSTTLQITGRARATVTNLDTDESVSFNISGPGTLTLNENGSFSGDLHGPNLLWTERAKSFPGVPAVSYTTGHVTFAVDTSGQTTSYNLAGTRTDVCAVLAP